MDTDNNGSKIQ